MNRQTRQQQRINKFETIYREYLALPPKRGAVKGLLGRHGVTKSWFYRNLQIMKRAHR